MFTRLSNTYKFSRLIKVASYLRRKGSKMVRVKSFQRKLTIEQKSKLRETFFNFIYSGTVTEDEFTKAFTGESKEEFLKELLTTK